jgi:hypothetical protein
MQGKKAIFLFLALLLPICVFLFLKFFGRNEFAVQPLFQDALPENIADCQNVHLPYKVDKQVLNSVISKGDSLGIVYFKKDNPTKESDNELARIEKAFKKDRIKFTIITPASLLAQSKQCIFLVRDPYDLVMVDNSGVIRGQYVSDDLDEMDRLITEVDIILKKY